MDEQQIVAAIELTNIDLMLNTIVRISFLVLAFSCLCIAQSGFVSRNGNGFVVDGKPYTFIGTNYWYGSLLGLEKDKKRGIDRLRRELDFLKANGVTNLRLLAGAEGSGLLNGVERVGPSLQPTQGKFDGDVLKGLDIILAEMAKRDMKAVIFFSNNWEWSGGFQQYLIWNNVIDKKWLTEKPDWDTLRDLTAKFYSCEPCKQGYDRQMKFVISRKNSVTKRKYVDDPTIMAWEIANEPRPMRPAANEDYRQWLHHVSAEIRSLDKNHLITTGHEGWIGTEDIKLFETVHADPNIDYITIHIWPKNWQWFTKGKLADGFSKALTTTHEYIDANAAVAVRLNKPLVIEEFGLPRDDEGFSPKSSTSFRDRYFASIFGRIGKDNIAGASFWAFGGTARPIDGQVFWKSGDDRMGDPPMEEQGLNTVFDSDKTTFDVIKRAAQSIGSLETKQ